jgi:hypothetical protein
LTTRTCGRVRRNPPCACSSERGKNMFGKIIGITAALVGSPGNLWRMRSAGLPAGSPHVALELGPDCWPRCATPTGCSGTVSDKQVSVARHRTHDDVPVGRPVWARAMMLSRNAMLISGVYARATPSQIRDSMPSLAHYALLITRRGSEWHVDKVPPVFALLLL